MAMAGLVSNELVQVRPLRPCLVDVTDVTCLRNQGGSTRSGRMPSSGLLRTASGSVNSNCW